MLRKWLAAVAMLVLAVSTANAQDAKTVVGNASKAMGIEGLNSIYLYGTAQTGNLGQNNNANQPWPMAAQTTTCARSTSVSRHPVPPGPRMPFQ